MRYLLDTNVISAGAPAKTGNPALLRWMDSHSDGLFLSSVTILEIEDGIGKMARERGQPKAAPLKAWLDTVVHLYADRILPFDTAVARVAGQLSDRARSRGHAPGFPDVVIAATAAHHKSVILTRNLRHFEPLGVHAHDPFKSLPSSAPV